MKRCLINSTIHLFFNIKKVVLFKLLKKYHLCYNPRCFNHFFLYLL